MHWKEKLVLLIAVFVSAGCSADPGPAEQRSSAPDRQPPNRAEKDPAATAKATGNTLILHRYTEPRESAFTILLPAGWIAEGGVLRVNPLTSNGAMNTVGAKVDFLVKKDAAGTMMIHWLPNFAYKDPRWLQGGYFPVGSSYMGMTVHPLVDAQTFLAAFVFQRQRPQARNVQVLERKPLPGLAKHYQDRATSMPGMGSYQYDAGLMVAAYDEGGVRYKEKMVAVIEDTGQVMLGTWMNRETLTVRAPAEEFDKTEPLFDIIQTSLQGNPAWVVGEQRGAAQRAANALETQRYIQNAARQIVENRQKTNAEIRHGLWLFMTSQEDFVNPHTGEVEQGSNQWKHRWVNGNGDLVYTDDPKYDPNWDPANRRTDFKLSRVRDR